MTSPTSVLRDLGLAVTFFTRLPLPAFDARGRTLASALWAAPIAGWIVGTIGAATLALAAQAGLAAGPSAALALSATLVLTGCLHEDGLSDTADGLGGGRDRDRKLEIMRDSRIGSFGAAALAMSLLLRWSALSSFADPALALSALVAAHGASRAVLPAFMRWTPGARPHGLAAGAGQVDAKVAGMALCLGAASLLILGPYCAVVAALIIVLVSLAFRALCLRQIGGQTGDTIGALQQICEIAVLLVASTLLSKS